VIDYAAKLSLACPVTATQTGHDLCSVLNTAVTRAEELLGRDLIQDCVDPETGEIIPIFVVTDNGPAMKSLPVARWFADRSHFVHVRTRVKSPHTNGVIERWFQTLKYGTGPGPLYRHEIGTVLDLADHVESFVDEYNQTRPHETIGWDRPLYRYLQTPNTKTPEI